MCSKFVNFLLQILALYCVQSRIVVMTIMSDLYLEKVVHYFLGMERHLPSNTAAVDEFSAHGTACSRDAFCLLDRLDFSLALWWVSGGGCREW